MMAKTEECALYVTHPQLKLANYMRGNSVRIIAETSQE